jgi:hypothetical protein
MMGEDAVSGASWISSLVNVSPAHDGIGHPRFGELDDVASCWRRRRWS